MFHDNRNPLEPEYTSLNPQKEEPYSGFYETGNIRPPKSRGGLLTMVLIVCIFCGGLAGGTLLTMGQTGSEPVQPGGLNSATSQIPVDSMTTPASTQPSTQRETGSKDTHLQISDTPESVPNVSQEGGLSLQEIYKKVSPSVVSVTAARVSGSSYGTGIIMSGDGYIITNCHVVSDAYALVVTLPDGDQYDACLVGKDSLSDLAVLRIFAENLIPAEFGNSDRVQVGDAVTAIGDPMGPELRGTMTDGIISAINRNLSVQGTELTLMQTTAALNEGNSGGPLINCYGQVVGINTAKVGDDYSAAGVEGLGFAIPINTAKVVVDQLIETGYIPGRPSLGVDLMELDPQYRIFYGLPEGLYITAVGQDSAADAAGLQTGDVILYLDEARIYTQEDLSAFLGEHQPGDQVSITIYRSRKGAKMSGVITLQEAGVD